MFCISLLALLIILVSFALAAAILSSHGFLANAVNLLCSNWSTISSTMVSLGPGQSFQPDSFVYEIGNSGNLDGRAHASMWTHIR